MVALTSALLAVFGLATFIKGPATFTDFGVDADASIKLALIASAAGLISVLALLIIPSVGRGLTYLAALLLVGVGIAVPILTLVKPEAGQHAVVQRAIGQVVCGVLANSSAMDLKVGDKLVPLSSEDTIILVSSCP